MWHVTAAAGRKDQKVQKKFDVIYARVEKGGGRSCEQLTASRTSCQNTISTGFCPFLLPTAIENHIGLQHCW